MASEELETGGDALRAVEAELQARREAAEASFRELAQRLANGEKVKAGDVEKVLTASGRDLAGLRAEVERFKHRATLKARIAEAEAAEAELPRLQVKIDAAKAKLKVLEEKIASELAPLEAERLRLQDRIVAAGSARSELFADAKRDPATAERLRDIRRRQNAADLQRQPLQDTRERITLNIKNAADEVKRGSRNAQADLENAQARLRDVDRRIGELDATLAELAEAGNTLFDQAAA